MSVKKIFWRRSVNIFLNWFYDVYNAKYINETTKDIKPKPIILLDITYNLDSTIMYYKLIWFNIFKFCKLFLNKTQSYEWKDWTYHLYTKLTLYNSLLSDNNNQF